MCRSVLLILCVIAFSSTIHSIETSSPVKSQHDHNVDVQKSSAKVIVQSSSIHSVESETGYLLPVNEHRFPQIKEDTPLTTSYDITEETDDTLLKNVETTTLYVPIPTIFNTAIVQGKVLPDAGDVYQNQFTLLKAPGHLSPNLIRAEIPYTHPRVIGTIGSGSLGYVSLGKGLYAVGSGSLGFAAYVPSQTGKGSITVQNKINKKLAFNGAHHKFNRFSEITPHAYPKPIDLKREVTEQTGL